ncbi:MAG: hypothetical protein ACOY3L_16760 [Pseudomonadota bacterium]
MMALVTDDSSTGKRALELAVTHAFFTPGSAAQIAAALSTKARKLHAADVRRIWRAAKERGELPKIVRPANGPQGRRPA